jgi:hypothetical protein
MKMKSKFVIFNVIVFAVLVILYVVGVSLNSNIQYGFAGNSWLNPVDAEYYNLEGMILQIFSVCGALIQLVFVNLKLLKTKNPN